MIKNEEFFFELQDEESYYIEKYNVIGDIGVFHYSNNRDLSGLINLNTGSFIGDVRKYDTKKIGYSFVQTYDVLDENSINIVNVKKARIYDALNKKLLCDNWIVVFNKANFCVLKNPYTGMYYIFNGDLDIFQNAYANVEEYTYNNIKFYVVTSLTGEKAIYDYEKKFVSDFIFKDELKFSKCDIKVNGNVVYGVYEVNGKKALYYNEFITNFNYDDIEFKNNVFIFKKEDLQYLYSGSVYNIDENELVYAGNGDLEFVEDAVIWKDSGRIKVFVNNEIIIDIYADEIFYDKDNFILKYRRGNKYSLVDKENSVRYCGLYSDIFLFGNYYFLRDEGVMLDVISAKEENEFFELRNLLILERKGDILILSNRDGYIIFDTNEIIYRDDIVYLNEQPEYVDNDYFISSSMINSIPNFRVFKKSKNLLLICGEMEEYSINTKNNLFYFKFTDGKEWEILELRDNKKRQKYDLVNHGILGSVNSVYHSDFKPIFTENYIIINGGLCSIMFSNKSLKRMDYDVIFPIKSSKFLNDEFYLINNIWYKYDETIDDIVKLGMKPTSLAIATYETEYGIVVVNETDGSVYNYKCHLIESSDVDGILKDYYENTRSLQLAFPNLKQNKGH